MNNNNTNNNGELSPNPLYQLSKAYSDHQSQPNQSIQQLSGLNEKARTVQKVSSLQSINNSYQQSNSSNNNRISSRQMLNSALNLANNAVNLDKENDFSNALKAYKEAMELLENVMNRVEIESKLDENQSKPASRRIEEGRRLKIIVS